MKIENELQNALAVDSLEEINRVFEMIFNRYFKLGMFISLQYLSEHDSIEIVDDAFVSFFGKVLAEGRCDIRNIKQYLCACIKNASIKKAKEQNDVLPYEEDIASQADGEPFALVETLFAGLSNEEQFVISEHALLDRKFKDIARELGKPLFTVTSIYRRGIMKIKRRLS